MTHERSFAHGFMLGLPIALAMWAVILLVLVR